MFGMTKTLIVVYKDEMLMNQLKKMVETNDDANEEEIVGTKDNSITIVSWTEKVWLGNKKAGNIKDKVLFLGDIKGTEELIPVIDVHFDENGVKFGWAGNQAILYADTRALRKHDDYMRFLETLADYPIPETIKKPQNIKLDEDVREEDDVLEVDNQFDLEELAEIVRNRPQILEEKKSAPAFLSKAKKIIETGADAVEKTGSKVAEKAGDVFRNKSAVKRQMLFYGVINLYRDGLEQFMNK